MPFRDRIDAGRRLAAKLERFRGRDAVVLALPRGGVPVAYEIARALDLPLDVILVRKLGVPYQPELAMGAIGEGGVRVLNDEVLRDGRLGMDEIEEAARSEQAELDRRGAWYRGRLPRHPLKGRIALVIDDGIATGSTARAACRVARAAGAAQVVLAAPLAPPPSVHALARDADEVVVLETPPAFWAIGQFYEDFSQTSDAEVVELLLRAATRPAQPTAADPPDCDPEVVVASRRAKRGRRTRDRAAGPKTSEFT